MRGSVFTDSLDMIADRFTPEVIDRMITAAAVPSDGADTSVLVIDDGPASLAVRLLHKTGLHGIATASGRAGLWLAQRLRPVVITLHARSHI